MHKKNLSPAEILWILLLIFGGVVLLFKFGIVWTVITLVPLLFVTIAFLSTRQKNEHMVQYEQLARVPVGKYLIGLPNVINPTSPVDCIVTQQDLVFIGRSGELDKISRDKINNIIVEDKSQISQRLTATRIITLGIFALAAPKKRKHIEFCLLIDWNDKQGLKQNTVFEFSGSTANTQANNASNTLRPFVIVAELGVSRTN